MRIVLAFVFLTSCSITSCNSVKTSRHQFEVKPTDDTKAETIVFSELKTINWMGSDSITFLAITVNSNKIEPIRKDYYVSYDGPVTIWNIKDSCAIHSLQTNQYTGLFLIDDLNNITDSIQITLEGRTGRINQGNSYFAGITKRLHIDQVKIQKDSNSINATNDWYLKWKQENPQYSDQRIRYSYSNKICD